MTKYATYGYYGNFMTNHWHTISQVLSTNLTPVLKELGYKLSDVNSDSSAVGLLFESTMKHLQSYIDVDCRKWTTIAEDKVIQFYWLRLHITSSSTQIYLKQLLSENSGQSEYQRIGWVFTDLSEIENVTKEVIHSLNDRLLNWVHNPIPVDKPNIQVSLKQRLVGLKRRVKSVENELSIAISNNDDENAAELREYLESLLVLIDKTQREIDV